MGYYMFGHIDKKWVRILNDTDGNNIHKLEVTGYHPTP